MRSLVLMACLFAANAFAAAGGGPPGSFIALCYHEVRSDVRDYPDPFAVDDRSLVQQFEYLRGNGYTPVSLDQIIAARRGGPALPPKAVLLTFDDAYLSAYTKVFPLLREYRFPAVVGVVGGWIDDPDGANRQFGESGGVTKAEFPTWAQLREMADSGLVELASHTYDLHHGGLANPQGNVEPLATTRIYAGGRYEGDAAWRARVLEDFERNAAAILRGTGRSPRAVVWPYGSFNAELLRPAADKGMPIAFTLEDGINTPDVPLNAVRRVLVAHNPTISEFAAALRAPQSPQPVRVVQVSLDDVYEPDPAAQDLRLSLLLERIKVLSPSHVFLTAYSARDGAPYFPNRHLAVRADLFNRVAWQLITRARVKVYAMLGGAGHTLPAAALADMYADLASHASFSGLVFIDDAPSRSPGADGFVERTRMLAARAVDFRAPLSIVRGVRAASLQALRADPALARRVAEFAAHSDYVTVSTPPAEDSMSEAHAAAALAGLAPRRAGDPSDTGKLVFLLDAQAAGADAQGERLTRQMRDLQLSGSLNFGYTGEDFAADRPALGRVAPVMSLRTHPLPLAAPREAPAR